jgi:hypothetical protein
METTMPYSRESNVVVEMGNRTIMKCVRYILDDAGRLDKYRAFAVWVVVYRKSCTPT